MWEQFIKDLPFYLLNLAAFTALVIITWLWARTRFMSEIAKYQTELASLQLQRNDQFFALEDDVKAKYERLRLILRDFRTHHQLKNADMLHARRNELSNVLILDYLPAMHKYTRLADEMFANDLKKRRQFIENHLNPFLQLSGDLFELMNLPTVLQLAGAEANPIRFNYMDFDFVFDFARKKRTLIDFGLRTAMNKHLRRMGFSKEMKLLN
jgi:hypothetical protein